MNICLVGAHSDDIELGVGGTISRLSKLGHDIWAIILTEPIIYSEGAVRKSECIKAFSSIGIKKDKIIFAGFWDGFLKCSPHSIDRVRSICNHYKITPNLVYSHSINDAHQDHVEAFKVSLACFKNVTILSYFSPLSCTNRFRPDFVSNLNEMERHKKKVALDCHVSQKFRIGSSIKSRPRNELFEFVSRGESNICGSTIESLNIFPI